MSKRPVHLAAVLEWSPSGVRAWAPGSPSIQEFGSVSEASLALGLKGKGVGVAISRRHAFLKSLNLPNAPKDEAMTVLKLQLERIFPLPALELAFDFAFAGEAGSEGRPAIVGAMKADLLRGLLAELNQAGVKAQWVAPAALGSHELAREKGLSEALIMEATDEGLAIDVVHQGVLAGSRVAGSRIAAIDVAAEAARTQAAYKLDSPAVLLAGGLGGSLGAQVKESTLAWAGAAGSMLNLTLPEQASKLEAAKVNGRRRMALIFWAAAAVIGFVIFTERDEAGAAEARLKKDFQRQEKSIRSSASLFSGRLAQTSTSGLILANAFEPAQTAADVVAVAASHLPSNAWLSGITYERGRRLQMKGTALNSQAVSAFVDNLTAEERFRDVQLVFANNVKVEDTAAVQFSVTLHVVGNLPIDDKTLAKPPTTPSRARRTARTPGGES